MRRHGLASVLLLLLVAIISCLPITATGAADEEEQHALAYVPHAMLVLVHCRVFEM